MQPADWLSIAARISLPCILAVIMQLLPVPARLSADLQAGHRAEQEGNNLQAAASYASVAEIQPWRKGMLEKAGALYYESNDFENAMQTLQAAQDRDDLSTQGQTYLADAYYQLEKYDQALSVWSALLAETKVSEGLLAEITGKLTSADLIEEQIDIYRYWITEYPDNTQAFFHLGLLQSVYKPVEAVNSLSQSKVIDPTLSAQVDLMLDTMAGLQEANDQYRLVMTGRTLGNMGEWAIANQAFQMAVDLDPEYGDAWAFLAESMQQLGKPALDAVEKANELSPDSVGVKALTAIYWRRQNEPERAQEIMQEIVELQPEEYVWLIEMGNISAQSGDLDEAIKYFQQAIEAEPENTEWRKELISFCLQNNYEVRTLALPTARVYLKLDNEGEESLQMMGQVMLELKDTLSAERYLTRALEVDPLNASAHLFLGQAYLMDAKETQAFNHLNAALSMSPQQSEIAQMAQRLIEKYFPDGAASLP